MLHFVAFHQDLLALASSLALETKGNLSAPGTKKTKRKCLQELTYILMHDVTKKEVAFGAVQFVSIKSKQISFFTEKSTFYKRELGRKVINFDGKFRSPKSFSSFW